MEFSTKYPPMPTRFPGQISQCAVALAALHTAGLGPPQREATVPLFGDIMGSFIAPYCHCSGWLLRATLSKVLAKLPQSMKNSSQLFLINNFSSCFQFERSLLCFQLLSASPLSENLTEFIPGSAQARGGMGSEHLLQWKESLPWWGDRMRWFSIPWLSEIPGIPVTEDPSYLTPHCLEHITTYNEIKP